MANIFERSIRELQIEEGYVTVPFNAGGFKSWLKKNANMTDNEADQQIELIRQSEVEFWEPGDEETFSMIADWMQEAQSASENLRSLYYAYVVETISSNIEYIEAHRPILLKRCIPFLDKVLKAYYLYLNFMEMTLGYEHEEDNDDDDEVDTPVSITSTRYPKVPLEDDFKSYLDESRYKSKTRDKMMTNLRKFNALVIDNGRGDSKWLEQMVQKSEDGGNIYNKRLIANRIFHHALAYCKDYDISEDALRGAGSALNAYIQFLIFRQRTKAKSKG